MGTRLGPYEVLSAVGAGGMGEVYRAYLSSDLRLMSVEIRALGGTLEPGVPKLLFEPHPLPSFFDAAADGERFLFISSGVEQSPPITLVQNWAEGVKK